MNFKSFLLGLILVSVFATTGTALAMTDSERATLIAQLQTQIAQLTQQISELLSQQQQGTTTTTTTWCHTFNTNLGYSNSGTSEVANLHIALQKQGISYSPDTINIYSQGTSKAIVAFQLKYGISQTGYIGTATRAKLNALYGCTSSSTTATTTCAPNWQCKSWSSCTNDKQTRSCADLNNCGTTTDKPVESQLCVISVTDCDVMSHWSACVNGQKSRLCSTTTVTGEISKTITQVQSCLDCTPSWQCEDWSVCANGKQTRTCSDVNNCQTEFQTSTETRSCTLPVYWRCGAWSSCENSQQRRLCTDLNHPYATQLSDSQYCTICGNGTCDLGESSETCLKDCITTKCNGTTATCSNGVCEAGEDASLCPQDCSYYCGDKKCNFNYGVYDYYKLHNGGVIPRETYWNCPRDCGYCGDGKCANGKNKGNCPLDCSKDSVCGNGTCENGETPENCSGDCGAKWLSVETQISDWDTCDNECNLLGKVCVEDNAVDKCLEFTDFQGNVYTGGAKLVKDSKNYTSPSCKSHWAPESYDKKYCCCQDRPENAVFSWFTGRVKPIAGVTCNWTEEDTEKALCTTPMVWDSETNECVRTKDVSVICDTYCNTSPYGKDYYSMFPNLSCVDPWNNLSKCCTCTLNNVCKDVYGKVYGKTVKCVRAAGNFQYDTKGADCTKFCSNYGLEVKLDKLKMDQIGKTSSGILYDICGRYSYYDRCCACAPKGSCSYDSDCASGTFCVSGKCSAPKCTIATEKTDCASGQICNGLSGSSATCISCSGEGLSSTSQCCRGLTYLTDNVGRGYCKNTSKSASCGDGICESGEAYSSCPQDCTCTPTCSSSYYVKNCGDDGCGGSCGTCPGGQACSGGFCKCTPVCTGKQCGSDGCGGSCGTCLYGKCGSNGKCITCLTALDCGTGETCNSSGECVQQYQTCQTNSDCPYSYICLNSSCRLVTP